MRNIILSQGPQSCTVLKRGISGKEILEKLVEDRIPILLDSGALMLELSNEKVAETWLRLLQEHGITNWEAAVFFDEKHRLRVKDRNHLNESSPYDLSPYREKMDLCIVYLDDAHTRGTDLKIPPPSRACVTLCAGITRDKMVQACMRMRLLGKGHTISFYASDEASYGIKALLLRAEHELEFLMEDSIEQNQSPSIEDQPISSSQDENSKLGSADVMRWVCENSAKFEEDGLVHWSASGLNYIQRKAVETVFNLESKKTDSTYREFGERMADQDRLTLTA
jgi:hypothetical protein